MPFMDKQPAPFDRVADEYDASFSQTVIGIEQRAIVWAFLQKKGLFDGMSVLELNCGTGEDALWLAKQGCTVFATDISPEMVELTRKKSQMAGFSTRITTQVLDFRRVADLEKSGLRFDLIFSNFGGMNCISPVEMEKLATVFPRLLQPKGILAVVVMGRVCWWEILYFLLKGQPKQAFRRFSKEAIPAHLGPATFINTWYYSPKELKKLLFSAFQTTELVPVGYWLPPSYLNPFFEKRPLILKWLKRLEAYCRGSIWASAADHYLMANRT
jgi:SAM-dependent methyltransferase